MNQDFADGAHDVGHAALGDHVSVVFLVVGNKPLLLAILGAVGFGQRHSRHLLLNVAEDHAKMPVQSLAGVAHAPVHHGKEQHIQRDHDHHRPGQRHGNSEEQIKRKAQLGQVDEDQDDARVQNTGDGMHFVNEPFDDATGAVARVKLQGQTLQVVEQIPSQVDDHAMGQFEHQVGSAVAADAKGNCGQKPARDEQPEDVHPLRRRGVGIDHFVDQGSDEVGVDKGDRKANDTHQEGGHQ